MKPGPRPFAGAAAETLPENERLASLRRKLEARKDTPGYEKNCEKIRAEIAKLEAAHSGQEFDL